MKTTESTLKPSKTSGTKSRRTKKTSSLPVAYSLANTQEPLPKTTLFVPPKKPHPVTSLATLIFGRFSVHIEGVGETVLDLSEGFSIARFLGISFSQMTRRGATQRGVACNVSDAFELISLDMKTRRIKAIVKPGTPVMELKCPDLKFLAVLEQEQALRELARREALTRPNRRFFYD